MSNGNFIGHLININLEVTVIIQDHYWPGAYAWGGGDGVSEHTLS